MKASYMRGHPAKLTSLAPFCTRTVVVYTYYTFRAEVTSQIHGPNRSFLIGILEFLQLQIQDSFGWDNDHLFSFYMSNRIGDESSEYSGNPLGSDPSSIETEPSGTAAKTEIRNLKLRKGKHFKYLLDYGDRLIQEMVTKSGLVTDDPLLIRIPVYIQSEFIIEADRNLALLPQGENVSWKL